MKLIMRMCDILEYGSQDDEYDFPIKGHNLNDDWVNIPPKEEIKLNTYTGGAFVKKKCKRYKHCHNFTANLWANYCKDCSKKMRVR